MARMGCLWGVEPLNRRKTQGDLLPISYKYNDSETGVPTATVTLFAMDDTAVWQNMLSSTTVCNMGEKSIWQKTTGQENSKISVCLKAKADGTKLKLVASCFLLKWLFFYSWLHFPWKTYLMLIVSEIMCRNFFGHFCCINFWTSL